LSSRDLAPCGDTRQKSGHKKPGLNKGSAGITSVPGLFSELFNVAASRPAQMTTECPEISPKRAFRQGTRPDKPGAGPMVNQAAAGTRHDVSLCFHRPSFLINALFDGESGSIRPP
jgi:hypothetical protein